MPRYIDAISVLLEPSVGAEFLVVLTSWFEERGFTFPLEANIIYNDFEDMDREPEIVSSRDKAISSILSWPGLGGTTYLFSGQRVSVFFYGTKAFNVDAVTLSLNATPYMSDKQLRTDFDKLVFDLHRTFGAKRTIIDYELLSPDSLVYKEIERVRNDVFEGHYSVDLF
jgi:hypothetical protein